MKMPQHKQTLYNSQPNILFLISDDHGYGDLSFLNELEEVSTPNLDRLRASGVYFDNAYTTAPICSPSRAGMIAGNYQQRWDARWFNDSAFPPSHFPTIAELLKQADYSTGYFGKVHYGNDQLSDRSNPNQHGFDESFYGLASQSMGRLHYVKHAVDSVEQFGEVTQFIGMNAMYENGQPVDCDEHLTIEFTNRALRFIEEKKDKGQPFFCTLAYNAVHNFTWQLPKDILEKHDLPEYKDLDLNELEYNDWYDGVISPNLPNGRAYYLAQLDLLDREIGRLLDYLEAQQLSENTVIIYLTDNGGSTCNYGLNTPLHGGKYSLYEGGVRVPYLLSWPGVVEPNSTSSALTSSLDILPTFCHLAGIAPTEVQTDGINLFDILTEQASHEQLFFDTGFQWSVRNKDWKLRVIDEEHGAVMSKRLLEKEHADIGQPSKSLVKISQSLDETNSQNVYESQPEIAKDLEYSFERWQDAMAKNHYNY